MGLPEPPNSVHLSTEEKLNAWTNDSGPNIS
jgi:hypothetical protein